MAHRLVGREIARSRATQTRLVVHVPVLTVVAVIVVFSGAITVVFNRLLLVSQLLGVLLLHQSLIEICY